jgi:two-component system NtrC family sensor kinase
MPSSSPRTYSRLSVQMFLVLLLFGLVPLTAMGLAGLIADHDATAARTRNVLEAMVKNRKATVELFLQETMQQLELVAGTLDAAHLSRDDVLEQVLGQMRQGRGAIVDLGFIDETGRHVAYVGPYRLKELDYHSQSWFTQVMVLGRYESDIFLGFRRFPHMVMAVKKRQGGRDFVLRATINTDLLSELVREGGLESGADVFILNRAGEYQTQYSEEHRLMEKADIGPIPQHSGVRIVERRDNGHRELLATSWLRGGSWVLVGSQRVPGMSLLVTAHPAVLWVFLVGLALVPLLSFGIARLRLRQMRDLQAERASLYEEVAQSQKMAAVGRLAAGVAHEINNPVAIVQAQAGVLSDLVEDSPDLANAESFRERLRKIEAQVERVRKITHRLLGFSRRVGPEVEPVDVAAALDETVGFVEKEIEASNVRLVREYEPDTPIIRSSLSQMQQVFLNLINNALDALGGAGELHLAVRGAEGGVVVEVSDDGIGIPEKELSRVFEPFYSTKVGDRAHSGLGLAVCQDIMRTLGGRISVRSEEHEGTTFTLWFPRQERGE